jgi:hypothetical protein
MIPGSNRLLTIILLFISFITLGCAAGTINIKHEPVSSPDNLLTSVSPMKVKLIDFTDKREGRPDATLVGGIQRKPYGAIYDVKTDRTVQKIIREALRSELTRNGHSVVEDKEDIVIRGEIRTFWLDSKPTPKFVDVIGNTEILVEIVNPDTGKSTFLGPYSGKNTQRRFMNPDADSVMQAILGTALSEMMQKMSSDVEFASALGKK